MGGRPSPPPPHPRNRVRKPCLGFKKLPVGCHVAAVRWQGHQMDGGSPLSPQSSGGRVASPPPAPGKEAMCAPKYTDRSWS